MKKNNEPYTEKHDNLNLCEKETYPLAKIFCFISEPQKGLKKTCPSVFLNIPIRRSYNPVLLDFFREMKDISKIKT